MLDLEMIDNTIEELEQGDTNFATCQKLASLYTVKQFYGKQSEPTQEVEAELSDILPQYRIYCRIKRNYQLGEASETRVLNSLKGVCKEIEEFFQILYRSTDMPEERSQLKTLVQKLFSSFAQ